MNRRLCALLCGLALACQPKPDKTARLSDYLNEVHRIETDQPLRLNLFLPQNSCSSCLKSVFAWLDSHSLGKDNVIVLAGLNRAELLPVRQRLDRHRQHLVFDVGYRYLSYQLPATGYPFYAVQSGNQPPEFHEINAANAAEELRKLERLVARP